MISIIAILVALGTGMFKGYTKDAKTAEFRNNLKVLADASERVYMREGEWPKEGEHYTSDQLETYAERIYDTTGLTPVLDPEGKYYAINYNKLSKYTQIPSDKVNYILQNPVGEIYYLQNLTTAGDIALNNRTPSRGDGPLITWNINDKAKDTLLEDNNMTANRPTDTRTYVGARATEGKTSGKWYWEVAASGTLSSYPNGIGVSTSSQLMEGFGNASGLTSVRMYSDNATKASPYTNWGVRFTTGDTIGVAMDLDLGTLEFYKNGVSLGVAYSDLASNTEYFPCVLGVRFKFTANFGGSLFKYAIPTGYKPYDYANALWFD